MSRNTENKEFTDIENDKYNCIICGYECKLPINNTNNNIYCKSCDPKYQNDNEDEDDDSINKFNQLYVKKGRDIDNIHSNIENKCHKFVDINNDNLIYLDDTGYDLLINRCLECGIDLGEDNPRQLCGKTYCMYYTERDDNGSIS